MSAHRSQDPGSSHTAADPSQTDELASGGSGAASALERMKAEHALRHRHAHGNGGEGAGQGEDRGHDT